MTLVNEGVTGFRGGAGGGAGGGARGLLGGVGGLHEEARTPLDGLTRFALTDTSFCHSLPVT